MSKFNSKQIEALRTEFAKIDRVCPDRLPEFRAMFAKMDNTQLQQVALADIKFLSKLAFNACVSRGMIG